jgi:hypothetical protein
MICSFARLRRRAVIGAVIVLLVVTGCNDPSGPSAERFDFESADHNAHWLLGSGVVITRGSVTVGRDDAIEQRLTLACGADSPGCSVPSHWARLQGVVDRSPVTPSGDMVVQWNDGRTALLRLAGDTAWVSHPLPPSGGFAGQAVIRFRR